jgi:hypothetical protein
MKMIRLLRAPSKLVALGLLVFSVGFGIGSWQLGLWSAAGPGVGLTPLLACVVLFPLGLLMLAEESEEAEAEPPLEWTPLLMGLGFCALAYAMTVIGFLVPSFVFLLVWTRLLYGRGWLVSLASALGIVGALGILFVAVLGVPIALWPW